MSGFFTRRRWWISAAAAVAVLAVVPPLLLLALDAGYFRPALIRFLEAHFRRHIQVDGLLHLELWSHHPRIVAEQVTIGNPPWVGTDVKLPDEMARIGRITVILSAPLGRGATLESLTLEDATLHLVRDPQGRANWQAADPTNAHGKGLPLLKDLLVEGARLTLDDQRRHLQFDGVASARGQRQTTPQRLHIEGKGQLNGKPVDFDLTGDPLDTVRHDSAYGWEFTEKSNGSQVTMHGSLPQPYNFDMVNADFEAAGQDLKDLYFLTGVTLANTGAYRLSGGLERRGTDTRFNELHLHTGQSDLEGSISIAAGDGRPQCVADLHAKLLRTADFGLRAAGRAPPADTPPRVFSNAGFNPQSLRRTDTQVHFNAQQVEAGRMVLQSLAGQMKIDHGVLSVTPLTAVLLQGKAEARIRLDANLDTPAVEASMRFSNLQLSALHHKDSEPPLEGLLQAQVNVKGRGSSVHQVLATANGSVSVELPGGMIRDSFAEIAGIDLRGLGLTLTHSKRETDVRCAAAGFAAHDGSLTARTLVIDTSPVVISGEGSINLDTEDLDLTLRGQPKDVRLLRLDAPLLVRGTLAQPSVAVQTNHSSVKLVDPGKGKDVDCTALLAAVRTAEP